MFKRILSLVLCLAMVVGMIPHAAAYNREYRGETIRSVDQCCHTLRVDTVDINYVRPEFTGYLIEITPQRVEDHFRYLEEVYIDKHPEAALVVNTGDHRDQEVLKTLAETITAGCKTNTEKANAIDRWLYRNIYYDINTSAYAYDTFYNRTGNCLSYANLMQFLLRSLGIPAVVGDGWRGDMKTATVDLFNYEGHAWCFVYLEGEWVLYDPLWLECGTTDRDYIAEWIYLDTVEFITPASDGDNLPPEAWDKPKVYYTDGRWYNFDNSHPNGYGNFTMLVNNQNYNFTPCQDELALGLEGCYDGWYILDGVNDKSGMQLGEIYHNSWLSYGEYDNGSYLNLTYAHANGMQIDGAVMEYDGVKRYMQCNTSFPVLAEESDFTMQYGCMAFKPGYVGPFVAPCWGSTYDTDFHIVQWESDTPEVCTIDQNGILTAVAPGFAQIKLTLTDQDMGDSGYYAITHINVCVSDENRVPDYSDKGPCDHSYEAVITEPTCEAGGYTTYTCANCGDSYVDNYTDPVDHSYENGACIWCGHQPAPTSGTCGDNLTWRLEGGNWLYITGSGRMYDYTEGGAPWNASKTDIYSIVLEGSVTYIGDYAFDGMTGLCMMSFNDNLTEIGDYAFRNCSNFFSLAYYPDTIVTIGEGAFQYCTSLTGAVTQSVVTIGDRAFEGSGCSNANLPDSVKTVGERAFADCPQLTNAKFGSGVTSIGAEAFSGCSKLEEIIFNGDAPSIGENAFAGAAATVYYVESNSGWTEEKKQNYGGSLTYISLSAPIVIRGNCSKGDNNVIWTLLEDGTMIISGTGRMVDFNSYANDENGDLVYAIYWRSYFDRIKTLIVEEGVTYIGDHAFLGASELTTVILADSVTEIGDQVFPGCGKLESVTFGNGLTETGIEVFRNCEALTEITLPAGDVDYGNSLFSGCTNLRTVTIPDTQTTLGNTMFRNCKALTQIEIPESITEIGSGAFEGSGLTSIEIPDTVTTMKRGVFENCDSLTEVEIPGSISKISPDLFKNCDNLTKVTFHEGVTEMSVSILANCPNVTEITIPSTVTTMSSTFEYAYGLKEVTFTGNAPAMYGDLFYGVTLTAYYPENFDGWTDEVMQQYGGTITWVPYGDPAEEEPVASGTCGDNLTWALTEDGTLTISGEGEMYDYYGEEAPWFPYREEITTLVIEEGITTVGEAAFTNLIGLKTVALPDSLVRIDHFAFMFSEALETIDLPDNLESIGQQAFWCCGLKSVVIPASVSFLDMGVFEECRVLTDVLFLSDPNLPGFGIGNSLFRNCDALEEIRVEDGHVALRSIDGALYFDSGSGSLSLNDYPIAKKDTTFRVADNTTYISQMAFWNASYLEEITIPAGVTEMGNYVFSGCNALKVIRFEGDMPTVTGSLFLNLNLTITYPCNEPGWSNRAAWETTTMLGHNGSITWQPDHAYEAVITEPTCTEQGYTTYTCVRCDHSYVDDYTEALGHEYEDGHCTRCGEDEYLVKWYSGTTSLNGTIDLNIYVLLSENLVNADDTYVRFTYSDMVVDVPMAEALHSPNEGNPNRYRFSCPIYAKQLADSVNVKFMKGEEMLGTELNYSVKQYCENQIKKSPDEKLVALCKALLNYGAAAQQLLNYNTENLANASLSDADKVLPDVNASAYAYSVTGSEDGIKAKSATLMLEDVVKVRVYFTLTGDKSIDEYTITIDGKAVTPSYNEKGWYVETDGIPGKDLEKMFEIHVGGITVEYGALSYVNSKVGGSNALESNISKVLFVYWQAAEALLG